MTAEISVSKKDRNCNEQLVKLPKDLFIKIYFLNSSNYISDFNKLWFNKYGVTNFLENDVCALISRIWFVQSREESSMFFGI